MQTTALKWTFTRPDVFNTLKRTHKTSLSSHSYRSGKAVAPIFFCSVSFTRKKSVFLSTFNGNSPLFFLFYLPFLGIFNDFTQRTPYKEKTPPYVPTIPCAKFNWNAFPYERNETNNLFLGPKQNGPLNATAHTNHCC